MLSMPSGAISLAVPKAALNILGTWTKSSASHAFKSQDTRVPLILWLSCLALSTTACSSHWEALFIKPNQKNPKQTFVLWKILS
jgi:hypothetical protein